MLSHALTIVINELETHLSSTYGAPNVAPQVRLANIAEGLGNAGAAGTVPRDILAVSMVNIREEKTLRNVSNVRRDDARMRVVYQNPPVFLNFHIMVVATHGIYANALLMLSRTILFFQTNNWFDHNSVVPASLTTNAPTNPLDRLVAFKLIFDLYSPTMEEVNHLWGTLGGKQYPFALYTLRLVEMELNVVQREAAAISQVIVDLPQKNGTAGS